MIFNLYDRLVIKLGDDEKHVFARSRLMYTEAAEIEKITGLSFGEWERELGRFSIIAVGALLHVLRKRDGQASDFATLQFNAAQLEVVPLHDDGSEFTRDEVAADLAKRMGNPAPDPTGNGAGPVVAENPAATNGMSPSSPRNSVSGRGSGTGSRGRSSAASKRASTPS